MEFRLKKLSKDMKKCGASAECHYTLLKEIAAGGFAKVKLAVQHHTKRRVAIKCVAKNQANIMAISVLEKEVQIQKELDHPNIVKILETLDTDDYICIVQQYCSGGDLLTRLQKNGPLSETQANIILAQIIQAMLYLDSKKIYHRDIKPENILFDRNDQVKLCDFGLACRNPDDLFMTECCGSASYMSPQIVGSKPYIPLESDIWSLGVLYHAMVTGQMLFPGDGNLTSKEEILNYDFKTPWNIPRKCRQLFEMMVTNVEKRSSLGDIWKNIPEKKFQQPYITDPFEQEDDICRSVVKNIQIYTKKDSEFIIDSIQGKVLNQEYALYHLLKKTKKAQHSTSTNSSGRDNKKSQMCSVTLDNKKQPVPVAKPAYKIGQKRDFRISSNNFTKKYKRLVLTPDIETEKNDESIALRKNQQTKKGRRSTIFSNDGITIPTKTTEKKVYTREAIMRKKRQKNINLVAIY